MKYSDFGGLKESKGLLFWRVFTLWSRKIKTALRLHDVTHTQFVVLALAQELHEKECDCTQKEISDFSMIDAMTVSTTVKLLVTKGLVDRIQHPSDTRAKQIMLTKKGTELLKLLVPTMENVADEFFKPLETENFIEQLKILSIDDEI